MSWETLTNRALDGIKKAFGEAVTHLPVGHSPKQTVGVYDAHTESFDMSGAKIISPRPRLLIKLSDYDFEPQKGDSFTIKGATYKVTEIQKDGHGGAELSLHKVI